MIDRKEFMQEMQLRQQIREAIKVVQSRRFRQVGKELQEERQLRTVIRQLINEADPAVTTAAPHANTGINALEDLFKNTNLLTVLRQGYKSLTSKKEQRESYKNHILNAVDSSLEVQDSLFASSEDNLQEAIDIDVGGPEENPASM
jgi:cysteinyl-tRNA synthetase